jgi:Ca-activated chloride channel family protein
LLCLALLRPYLGFEDIKVETRGDDVIFLVDISRSMYAKDVPPTRLEVARRKIKDLVTALSADGRAARFGITVFAGDGYTVCPVTTDRGVVGQFVDSISPELVSSLGSNLKAGIDAAISRMDQTARTHSRVIVISDGEDDFLDAQSVIKEISSAGTRFDVLGIGTLQGSTIELPNGTRVTDQARAPVVSTLREESLQAIAQAGGGVYVRATLDDSDIQTLTAPSRVVSRDGALRQDSSIRTYREFGPWLVLSALVVLLCAAFLRGANPLAIIVLSLTMLGTAQLSYAQEEVTTLNGSAFQLYQQGDYESSAKRYAEELQRDPKNRALQLGLASALYRLKRYDESEKIFKQLGEQATNGRDYFESTYNQGNALLGSKRYQQAIDAYLKALDIKPDDVRARHNLEVARALLEEAKNKPTPSPTPTPTPTPTSDQQSTAESSPSPEASPSQSAEQTPAATPSGAPTPERNSTPSPGPSAEASAQATQTAMQTGVATTTPNPLTPQPTASPQAGATANPSTPTPTERLKESLDKSEQENDPIPTAVVATPAAEELEVPEVDAWLQSLPDSPLLIRRHRGAPSKNGQTW